jgi:5-formyltetrahydrofolate cyclo-ligase
VTTPHHPGGGPADLKADLRDLHLARRRARPAPERAAAAAAVATALLRGLRGVRTLAAYVPEDVEPGYGRLPAAYTQLGARVLLPVVPAEGRQLGPTAIGTAEVVVVPALAVDRRGVRLGRGGGYYDRALAHARRDAVLVAVVFDDELVDELPAEPHDLRVTAVVTPGGGWEELRSAGRAMS